jgi:hypothetical protein
MSLVKIKNITKGKLVFLAVRDAGDFPLTLEAGEEKDVVPSMVTQPSLQAVLGTKVLILTGEVSVAPKPVAPAPVTPPVIVMEEVVAPVAVSRLDDTLEVESAESPPSNIFKPRKGRR